MKLHDFYEHLKQQGICLSAVEDQLSRALKANEQNISLATSLVGVSNFEQYLMNQRAILNALLLTNGDMKLINSYVLLDIEAELRGDKDNHKELNKERS